MLLILALFLVCCSAGTINCQVHNSEYTYVFNEVVNINPLCDVEVTSAEVTPDLPADLQLDKTGMISGTLGSVKTTKVMYTVKLTSTTGDGYSGSYSIYITVNEPISNCNYHVATFVFVRNYYNTYLPPECNSKLTRAAIKSGFPSGIQVNTTTGALYGITTDSSGTGSAIITFTGLGNREVDVTIPFKVIGPDDSNSIMTPGFLLRIKDGNMNWNQWRNLWKELDTADTTYEFNSLATSDYNCGESGACAASKGRLKNYFIKFTSTLKVEETGTYLFSCNADDYMAFFIDDMENPKTETTFWTMTNIVTTSLAAGWHPIGIIMKQNDGGHGLHLKWKKEGNNDYKIIDSNHLRYIPPPVQYVNYFSDSFIAYSDQQFNSKPTIQGYVGSITEAGSSKLSDIGLSVSPSTGAISGTPTSNDDRLKNILLKYGNSVSDYGTFDVPLTFQIVRRNKNSVVPGLRANYYKSPYRGCEWREIDGSDILTYSRIDTTIQHSTSDKLWDELTADFQQYYTVEWTGVIVPPAAGTYTITISADTGARLELNNTIITAEGSSCDGIKTATGRFYLTDDVNTIRIVYWKAGGSTSKSFQITWSSSTIQTPVVIGSSYFGRLPTKPFNYHYDIATYISGVAASNNCPVFKNDNDKSQYTKYEIDPPLPSGMGLNSDNCISGTPSGSYALLDYKISASNDAGTTKISTTVKIQIRKVSIPTRFEYPSEGITTTIGNKVLITPTLVAPEDSLITFTSDPSLPTGLYFDERGAIYGYPTQSFSGTITVTAMNEAGSVDAALSVTISDCSGGGNFVSLRYQMGDPQVDITVTGNNEVLYVKTSEEHIVDSFYQTFFCSSASSINVEIRSTAKRGGVMLISGYGNVVFSKFAYPDGEFSKTYTVSVVMNGEPQVTYPSQITATVNEEIRIYPTQITNGINRFEIGLLLPLGLNLNKTSGEIYGSPSEAGTYESKIVGYNLFDQQEQSTEAIITFVINGQCQGSRMLFTIEADVTPESTTSVLRVKSYSSNSYLIDYDSLTQSSRYRYSKCINQDTLLITYGSSKVGSNSVTYRIYRQGVLINTLSSRSVTEVSVLFVLAIDSSTEWEYSSSVAGDDWKTSTGGWSKARPGRFPDRTGITTYYRTTFDTSGIDLTSLLKFQLTVTYEAGIVVYINGKEFYRRNFNVNVGTITSTTEPNRDFDTASAHPLYGHSRLLNSGINYIAVEIHRKNGGKATETFRGELLYDTQGNGLNFLMPNVDITSQNNLWFSTNVGTWDSWQNGVETFRKLFDQNLNSKYLVEIPNANDGLRVRYSFFDGAASLIDEYVIGTANDCIGRDPKRWVVEGLRQFDNLDWTWEKIVEVNDANALPGTPVGSIKDDAQENTRNKYNYFRIPNPKDYVYEAVRLTIFEIKKPNDGGCDTRVQLSEFNVRNYYSLTCPAKDGYPETVIGQTVRVVCPDGYDGVRTRICNNDGNWGDEDKSGCSAGAEASRIDYFPSLLSGSVGVSIEPMVASPNGIVLSYEISPRLPDGLSLDPKSGIISGIPSEEVSPQKTYTVTGRTLTSRVLVNIMITINTLKCESKTEFGKTYPAVPVGGIIIGKCLDGYSGYSTSVCVSTGSGASWGPWDKITHCNVGQSAGCQFINDVETKVGAVVNQPITCSRPPTTVTVEPFLPNALTVTTSGNGLLLSGTANIASAKQTYTINATYGINGYDVISFDLSVYETITSCTLGFTGSLPIVLNVETTIIPAECNSIITSYQSNNLPPGFTIDSKTGYIKGIATTPYSGSITVSVSNPSNTFQYQIPVTITDKVESLSGLEGYITNEGQITDFNTIYNQYMSGSLVTNKLPNMPENIASLHVSETMIWPGPMTRKTYYWVVFKGYMNVRCAGTYYIQSGGDDKMALFIDDMTTPQYINTQWNAIDEHNMTLTLGPHEVMIMYHNAEGSGNIGMKWRCRACGINTLTPIEDSVFSHGSFAPLQRITYPVSDIILIKGINSGEIRPTVVGEVTSWSIDRDTPPGVVFQDGIFSGTPTEAYPRREYTIIASNTVTATQKVYLGTLDNTTDTMAKGLVGEYYSGVITSCEAIDASLIPENYALRFERVESDGLNFEESVAVWNGLSGEFQNSYIAFWSGYLYVQEKATYSFTMTCQDWCSMYISTEKPYTAEGCGKVTIDIQLSLNQGFQYFAVSYGKTNSGRTKSFSISWSQDTGNFQFDKKILDNNYLYHKPESYLEYTYKKARYISNVEIKRNTPLFVSVNPSAYKSFKIKPSLPSGLFIDETTGAIYGKCTSFSVANIVYTITATSTTGLEPLTSKIEFAVEPRYIPSDLVYPDIDGQIGQQLFRMVNNVKVTSIIPTVNNAVSIFYQLETKLPKGLSLDPSTGGISGTPLETFSGTVRISASNPSGRIEVDVNMVIRGCDGGKVFQKIDYTIGSGDVSVVLASESGMKFYEKQGPLNAFRSYEYQGCANAGTNVLNFTTGSSSFFGGSYVISVDGLVVKSGFYEGKANTRYSFRYNNVIQQAVPTLTYETKTSLIYGEDLRFNLDVVNGCKNFVLLNPIKIPEGITFDTETGLITGSSDKLQFSPQYSFTVECSNDIGTSSPYKITIDNLGGCDNEGTYFKIRFKTGKDGNDMSVRMRYFTTQAQLFSLVNALPDYSEKTLDFCVIGGVYEVIYGSASNKKWSNEARVDILMDSSELYTFQFKEDTGPKTEKVTLANYARETSLWWFGNTEPETDLYKYELDKKLFTQRLRANQFPPRLSTTNYYALEFYFNDDVKQIYSIAQTVTYDAGIVMYLNGKEFYRKYLPSGYINFNTRATKKFDTIVPRTVSAAQILINNGYNYLVVETHKHRSSQTLDPFKMSATPTIHIGDNCWGRTDIGGMHGRTNRPDITYEGEFGQHKAVDYVIDTYLKTVFNPGETVELEWWYYNEKAEFFSRFDIYTGVHSGNYVAKSFKVYGANDHDDPEYELLVEQNNIKNSQWQVSNAHLSNNYKSYHIYKVVIPQTFGLTNGKYELRIPEIRAVSCTLTYCQPDGIWPLTASRYTATMKCSGAGESGYIKRTCSESTQWGQEDRSACKPSATSISYNSMSSLDFPIGYEKSYLLTSNGGVSRYTIKGDLPSGVLFNSETGEIRGKSTSKLTSSCVVSAIINAETYPTVSITITSDYITCKEFDGYKETTAFEESFKPCDDGYEGFKKRVCSQYSPGDWGDEITTGCKMLKPRFSFPQTQISVIQGEYKTIAAVAQPVKPKSYSLAFEDGTDISSSGITISNEGIITFSTTNTFNVKTLKVTGTNDGGSTTVDLLVSSFSSDGTTFTYSQGMSFQLSKNVEVTSDQYPQESVLVIGAFKEVKTVPLLPTGLQISTINGMVYGTPIADSPLTNYVVTAISERGISVNGGQFSLSVTTKYCSAATNYTQAEAGQYSKRDCPRGYKGSIYRYCPLKPYPLFEEEVNNCTAINPIAFSYPNGGSFTLTVGIDVVEIVPIIEGNVNTVTFTITSGELPEGLYLEKNGKITGAPISEGNSRLTIQAKDTDPIEAYLTLTIVKAYCESSSECQRTEAGGLCTKSCGSGMDGLITIRCSFSATPEWMEPDTTSCIAVAPESFTYPMMNQLPFYVGMINSYKPSYTGGKPDKYEITKGSVPDGITFNIKDGMLIGSTQREGGPYTFTVTASNSRGSKNAEVTITSVLAKCPERDGFEETIAGGVATKPCTGATEVGEIVRECPREPNPQWGPIQNKCKEGAPIIEYPAKLLTVYLDVPFKMEIARVQGNPTEYEVEGDLPPGITINPDDGTVSGTVKQMGEITSYVVYVYATRKLDSAISNKFLLSFDIARFTCASEGSWPSANYGYNSAIFCHSNYTGIQTRSCSSYKMSGDIPIGQWGSIDDSKCILNEEVLEPPNNDIIVSYELLIPRVELSDMTAQHYQALQETTTFVIANISKSTNAGATISDGKIVILFETTEGVSGVIARTLIRDSTSNCEKILNIINKNIQEYQRQMNSYIVNNYNGFFSQDLISVYSTGELIHPTSYVPAEDSGSGTNVGLIIGLVIAGVAVLLIVCGCVYCRFVEKISVKKATSRKKKQNKLDKEVKKEVDKGGMEAKKDGVRV